jgi:membrane protein DedA with SNARE-associated domain
MWVAILVVCGFVLGAAADWTTTIYDVIIVGAGPAGIIGTYFAIYYSRRAKQLNYLPERLQEEF